MTRRVSPSSRMAVEYDWSEVEAASSHEISVVKRSLPRSPTLLGRNHTSADQSRWHVGGVRQSLGGWRSPVFRRCDGWAEKVVNPKSGKWGPTTNQALGAGAV